MTAFAPRLPWIPAIALLALQNGCAQSHQSNAAPSAMEPIRIAVDAPSAGWTLQPLEAWETEDKVYCLFQLSPPAGLAAQVITPLDSGMRIPATAKPIKRVLIGKTWNWGSQAEIDYPESLQHFHSSLPQGAKRLEIKPLHAAERQP